MTVYIGNILQIYIDNFESVWNEIRIGIRNDIQAPARFILYKWATDNVERRYNLIGDISKSLTIEAHTRKNYYYRMPGENYNPDRVIYRTRVSSESVGWDQVQFFENLGYADNARWPYEDDTSRDLVNTLTDDYVKRTMPGLIEPIHQGLKRRAEQEYLLQNMVKGAMYDAAKIANTHGLGIAVRGTDTRAHMGIESGNPTKAQEFKSKTSKEIDLWLCDEMEFTQIGSVVHYDPRVGWTSQKATTHAMNNTPPMFQRQANHGEWLMKWQHISNVTRPRLKALGNRINQNPDINLLSKQFFKRSKEYVTEDYDYRKGHFAPHTTLNGPYIRLKLRPNTNMFGDHDLFAFTYTILYGILAPMTPGIASVQTALQQSPDFQAQHGGTWYWRPRDVSHVTIKNAIMTGHSPDGDEPLVYIQPGYRVSAAYFTNNRLESVWQNPSWTKWMKKTTTGKLYLEHKAKIEAKEAKSQSTLWWPFN
ncbi:MAG: hypothetical protein GY749_50600 [Desulfobacteraceae bacterium]|nr:hypothetical protein [Desulfobacteraceae bacterium]